MTAVCPTLGGNLWEARNLVDPSEKGPPVRM